MRTEGPRALFKGVLAPCVGVGAINAIIFGVEGEGMRYLVDETPANHMIAGILHLFALCVLVCLHQKLSGHSKRYHSNSEQRHDRWRCTMRRNWPHGTREDANAGDWHRRRVSEALPFKNSARNLPKRRA